MKKQIKLIFLLLLTIIFSQITTAYFGNQWIEGESKSTKDPLYIDMPDEVHQMVPTTVKVYINDPIILENAQYAEIEPGNSNAYMLSGNKFSLIGGGAFRKTMVYNGEKSFEFGFRPTDRIGLSNSVKVTFYMAKKAPSKEQVDTRDEESPFFGYDCHWETNDLLCSEEEGCQICNHPVGLVMKYFMVSETDESVSIPTRVDFTDRKKERESTIVGSQDLYYKEEKQYISNGNEYTSNERYYIGLDIWEMDTTFEEYKENDLDGYTGESENVDNPYVTVNDIFASGPEVTGKAYEKVYNKPPNTKNSAASAEIHYQLHAEMSPIGSGVMRIKASRYTVFEKGTSSDGELEAIRNDVLNMLSSYKLSKGKIIDVEKKDYMKPIWNVRGEPKEEETTDTHYVTGHITNYFDHPMRYMEVIAKIDGVIYEGITDEDGIYKILLVGLELKEDEKKDVVILAKFNYVRDSKNYFNIFFRKPNNRYSLVQATKKGTLVEGEHLQIDFRMDGEGDFTTNIPNKEDLKHYSLNYFHTAESVEFVLETLKEDMDYKLPVTVYVGNQDKKTLYNPSDSRILISADDASLSDSDRPDNREYHEFMHALMYDIYNTWPEDRRLPGTVNHNGFHNPSTADSYMEGFAEFMAMVISDEMGEPNPQLYAGFGSMDQNYKMWDGKGFDEEFAIASLLWDMYDEYNENGDELTISIEDMWKVLKVKRKDFYEYYKAFKTEFPKKVAAIDKLFILHGIYDDTRIGNQNYDKGEPLRYEGEGRNLRGYYIDLSGNISNSPIEWENNLTIGKSAEYNRPSRSSAGRIPGAFLKIENDDIDFYKIIIASDEFTYEYVVDRKDELIYIHPLPSNTDATITVAPLSQDYIAGNVFIISSEELNEKLFSDNLEEEPSEYFAEHEFNLKKTGSNEDEKYELYGNTKPTYSYEGNLGEEYEIKVDKNTKEFDEGKGSSVSGFSFSFGKILFFLSIGVFVYFYIKKPKFKKESNKIFKKIIALIEKAIKWFMKNGVPFIVKITKWIIKTIVKIINLIFHHSKKAYRKAKPHVKKAHENVKMKIKKQKEKKNNNKKGDK